MSTFSKEHIDFLKKRKREQKKVTFFRIVILICFLGLWELAAQQKWLNTFLSSSPSLVVKTIYGLFLSNDLWQHIGITVYETLLSFLIASALGLFVAALLWWKPVLAKIVDPYLTVFNSLPKVALGPLIIIWVGASTNSIIFMALLITTFLSIIDIYQAFLTTDQNYITLLRSFHASKRQIFQKVVLPSNYQNIINSLKINIGMSFIGVIMGELLVSKKGLGYLIMYGSQVFNINLVIASVFLLGILSFSFYYLICILAKKVEKKNE